MAKKTAEESRHGKIPQGWTKQGLQLPKHVADEFRHHSERFGSGGVKFLGTAAIDIINQMPQECREAIAAIAYQTTWPDPLKHDPKPVWEVVVAAAAKIAEEKKIAREQRQRYFDMLIDQAKEMDLARDQESEEGA